MDTSELKGLGVLSLLNFANKHTERLAAHPVASITARAAIVRTATTDLENSYAGSRPLRALWSAAVKVKDAADDDIDDYVSAMSYDLLAPSRLKGDRDAADYRVLFPEGNIEFINGPDGAELVQVQAMVKYLKEHPAHPMADRATALDQKAEVMKAALGPATASETAYFAALAVQRERKKELVRVIRKNVRFLRDQLDGDETNVNALFPSIAESKKKEEEEPTF